jgi:hypothetical protein
MSINTLHKGDDDDDNSIYIQAVYVILKVRQIVQGVQKSKSGYSVAVLAT